MGSLVVVLFVTAFPPLAFNFCGWNVVVTLIISLQRMEWPHETKPGCSEWSTRGGRGYQTFTILNWDEYLVWIAWNLETQKTVTKLKTLGLEKQVYLLNDLVLLTLSLWHFLYNSGVSIVSALTMDLQGLTGGGVSGLIIVLVAERVKEVYSTERGLVPTRRMYSKYFSASFFVVVACFRYN